MKWTTELQRLSLTRHPGWTPVREKEETPGWRTKTSRGGEGAWER